MAIFKGSRYESVPVYTHYNIKDESLEPKDPTRPLSIPTLRRRDILKFNSHEAFSHIFQRGDRIDLLAHKYYGDAQLWWVILDANPKHMTPWDIPVGAVLIIPPITSILGGVQG